MTDQLNITEIFHPDVRDIYPSIFIKASPEPIACRMFVCKRPFDVKWAPVLQKTLERVLEFIHQEPLLRDRMLLYFGADSEPTNGYGSLQQDKNYWEQNRRSKELDIREFHECEDVFIKEHKNALIYASCASVSENHLPTLFESMRRLDRGVISLPLQPLKITEQLVRDYFEHSRDESSPYWDGSRICEYICRAGGVHLDIYGGFDDRELEIYIHYRPDLVPLSTD